MRVYKTKNYKKFKFMRGNRDIDLGNVAKIVKGIQKNKKFNLLEWNPIMVDRDMRVIDGQNRLAVCKRMNLPVYYVMVPIRASIKLVQLLNINVKRWSTKDFVVSYAELGNQHYVVLREFMKTHKIGDRDMSPNAAAVYLGGDRQSGGDIRSGRFKQDNYELADRAVELEKAIRPYFDTAAINMLCRRALYLLVKDGIVDQFRFIKKMKMYTDSNGFIRRLGVKADYLRKFNEIYNWMERKNNKVNVVKNLKEMI